LDVRLVVSADTVGPSAPVTIEIVATNTGLRPLSVWANPCPQPFDVLDESGEVVGPEPVFCVLVAHPRVVVAPGESLVLETSWAARGSDEEPLAAGRYFLVGWSGATDVGMVRTGPVAVHVVGSP
jgi:hypothetical protein